MKTRTAKVDHSPIVRLRVMVAGIVLVAVALTGPLLAVWKEVYINSSSLRLEMLSDSLATLSREIAALRMSCARLASNERIESFARNTLDLEYPVSSQMVILHVDNDRKGGLIRTVQEFFADLRKPRARDKG